MIKRPVRCEKCGKVFDVDELKDVDVVETHILWHLTFSDCYVKLDTDYKEMSLEYYQMVYTLEMMEKWYIQRAQKSKTTP